jgi:hypothetical protein
MRFYTQQHRHYCGIDLHARMMCLCVPDGAGAVRLSRRGALLPEMAMNCMPRQQAASMPLELMIPRA